MRRKDSGEAETKANRGKNRSDPRASTVRSPDGGLAFLFCFQQRGAYAGWVILLNLIHFAVLSTTVPLVSTSRQHLAGFRRDSESRYPAKATAPAVINCSVFI